MIWEISLKKTISWRELCKKLNSSIFFTWFWIQTVHFEIVLPLMKFVVQYWLKNVATNVIRIYNDENNGNIKFWINDDTISNK